MHVTAGPFAVINVFPWNTQPLSEVTHEYGAPV